jgi:hypothetical protein
MSRNFMAIAAPMRRQAETTVVPVAMIAMSMVKKRR